MIKNENTGRPLSVEYFKQHIPSGKELSNYLWDDLDLDNANVVYDLLQETGDNKTSTIYHVDTFLYDNIWRVQIKVRIPIANNGSEDIRKASALFRLGTEDSFFKDVFIEAGGNTCICKLITFKVPFKE